MPVPRGPNSHLWVGERGVARRRPEVVGRGLDDRVLQLGLVLEHVPVGVLVEPGPVPGDGLGHRMRVWAAST
ncbi:MAG: hypothetical protein ACRD0A_19240 [Acidimicrobiales bacterium]